MSASNSIHSLTQLQFSPCKSPSLHPLSPHTTPPLSPSLPSSLSFSMDSSNSNCCCTRAIILLALLLSLMTPGSHALDDLKFWPAAAKEHRALDLPNDGARGRRLGPFQLCLACKCCAAATPTPVCATMPCCFGIDCQLPNKPFGVCAFVPKSCNCTSCAV